MIKPVTQTMGLHCGLTVVDSIDFAARESPMRRTRKQNRPKNLRATFAEHHQVSVCEVDDSCIDDVWYTAEEYDSIRESVDPMTRQRKKHIAGIRRCYVHTILDLQDQQLDQGVCSPKGLARLGKKCSKYATRDAIARANEVASEVLKEKNLDLLEVLDGVLDIMEEPVQICKNDTTLRPPQRFVSP